MTVVRPAFSAPLLDRAAGVAVAFAVADAATARHDASNDWTRRTDLLISAAEGSDLPAGDRDVVAFACGAAVANLGDRRAAFAVAARGAEGAGADTEDVEATGLLAGVIHDSVCDGMLDIHADVDKLNPRSAARWIERFEQVGGEDPVATPYAGPGSWLVEAWRMIVASGVRNGGAASLIAALGAAVDTADRHDGTGDGARIALAVAAMAGARHGASAVPTQWRARLGGMLDGGGTTRVDVRALTRRAARAARGGDDALGWPSATDPTPAYAASYVLHDELATIDIRPHAPGRFTAGSVLSVPDAVAAGATDVVSLCRIGSAQVPSAVCGVEVWLTDTDDVADDPNLDHVVLDTARYIAGLLREGRHVHLHCVAGASRTPTVAAVALHELGFTANDAVTRVGAALFWNNPAQRLIAVRHRLLSVPRCQTS